MHVLCERRFFAGSSFVQAQLIPLNNSGAARAQDQSVQRLDLRSRKQAEGLPKDRLKHIDSPVSKFTAENVFSRWKTGFHANFTVFSR